MITRSLVRARLVSPAPAPTVPPTPAPTAHPTGPPTTQPTPAPTAAPVAAPAAASCACAADALTNKAAAAAAIMMFRMVYSPLEGIPTTRKGCMAFPCLFRAIFHHG